MFRSLVLALAFAVAGCVQFTPGYLAGSHYQRALLLYEKGYIVEAKTVAQKVEKEGPEYHEARKLLARITALSLELSKKHMELGMNYEKAGITGRAVSEYRAALRYDPTNAEIERKLLTLLKDKPSAYGNLKKGVTEEEVFGHYRKGRFFLESKSYRKAIDEFNIVLGLAPSYLDTAELVAKARKDMEDAVAYHMKRGVSYFQAEEIELAIREWDRVLEMDPANAEALEYMRRAESVLQNLKKIQEKRGE